jgi:predicted lipoprotein with Yx(FWY)xxD motif
MLSRRRLSLALAATSLVALALAGCSTPAAPTAEPTPEPTSVAVETPEPAPVTPDLAVADTSLGTIVVDSAGRTVYYYDADSAGSGVSACSGGCLDAWPSVHPLSNTDPALDGISAEVGVITGTDGLPQLTLNGLPVYYYRDDAAPGDVLGQALGGVWWVIAPDGSKIS